jgi:hypothetical protein
VFFNFLETLSHSCHAVDSQQLRELELMKHDLSARGTARQTTVRSRRIVVCALTVITLIASGRANAQSSKNSAVSSDNTQFSAEAISHREEELRRKEAELLQAINSGTQLPQNIEPAAAPSNDVVTADQVKVSGPIHAPESPIGKSGNETTSGDIESQSPEATQSPQFRALQEMGNHPALDSKKNISPPVVQPAKVTIRESSSKSRKPDTFLRVDRDSDKIDDTRGLLTNPRTVSLQEIEAERDRPAPYQYEAVATIAGRDATLRTGPRNADRALGSAPRFSEVNIDYRSGEWYRVQTGSGLRGWIQGRNLLFDAGISHNSTVRIGAVKQEPEDRLSYRP